MDYLKFDNSYWSTLETCIRNFDGMNLLNLEGSKDEITETYKKETESAIKKALEYIDDNVSTKDQELSFLKIQNVHAPKKILDLFVKRALKKINKDKIEHPVSETTINLRDLPPTTINTIEVRVKEIAQNWLIIDAIEMAIKRAKSYNKDQNEDKNKIYRFKKFRTDSKEIFEDLMFDSNNEFQESKLTETNAHIINEAFESFEIIENQLHLINKRKFKKTLGEYFRPRLKELRKKHANS